MHLVCKDIEIKFAYRAILQNISFKLKAGQKIALVGMNGCGKTSLLRVLAGLSRPYSGSVYRMDEELWPQKQLTKEHFCLFLSYQPALLLEHSALENLEYYCRCFNLHPKIIDYQIAAKQVGIEHQLQLAAKLLSTGQQRRLSFAALQLIKPKIILADELTNGLDHAGNILCMNILNQLANEYNTAMVLASHDPQLIAWCDQIINLEEFISKKFISNNICDLLI